MMRDAVRAVSVWGALAGMGLALAGCSSISKTLGFDKSHPDEFTVASQPPLILPPNYSLKPPAPNTIAPRDVDTRQKAIDALFPDGLDNPKVSSGEAGLLRRTGGVAVEGSVRQKASDDQTNVVEKGAVLKDIADSPDVAGPVAVERAESKQFSTPK